jgi:L-serine dehydratase
MEAMSILSPGAGFSLIERNSLVPGTRQDNPPDTLLLLGILADRPEAMLLSKLNGMKGVAWARYVPPVRAFFRKKGVQTVPVTFAWMSEASELPLHERIIQREMERDGKSREEVRAEMARVYGVMKEAAELGLSGNVDLLGGFVSKDDAARLHELASGRTLAGSTLMKSASYALSVATVNAAMGRIVACPTGGASGLLPGVLLAVMDAGGFSLEEMIDAMFVAAGTGAAIGRLCSFSGSVGGCMAEIGFASAMAASAVAHLEGAGPRAVTHAAAMAMKSVLGLVCDPVGGPVEIPCIKRNAVLAGVALVAGEMAVAGIESAIPPDEVVDAAKDVQLRMPQCFKSTLDSSLAATRKGKELRQVWLERL